MLKELLESMDLEAEPGKPAHKKFVWGINSSVSNNFSLTMAPPPYPHCSINTDGTWEHIESAGSPVTKVNVFDMMKRIEELERKISERTDSTSAKRPKARRKSAKGS